MAQVPEVLVLGIVRLARDAQGDVVRLGVLDLLFSGFNRPLSPRGDDRHIRREVLDGKLKAHLIVALAGAAVADRVRALLDGDVDETLRDQRAGRGGAEEIFLIRGAGLEAGHDVIGGILLREIEDIELRRAGLDGLFLQPLELVRLPDVAGDGDDLAVVVVLLQPRDDDRGIQTAGVGEHDFLDVFFLHDGFLREYLFKERVYYSSNPRKSQAFIQKKVDKDFCRIGFVLVITQKRL